MLIAAIALLLLIPSTVLFAEVVSAMTYRRGMVESGGERLRLAVLMPAHNEAAVIAPVIHAVLQQLTPLDRLVVVADNCSDQTAAIAVSAGAEVIERTDATRRGKGFALDFGIRHLARDAPALVVVLDADSELSSGSLDRLARACASSGRPTQALYLMQVPKDAGLKLRVAQFAWVVKNHVRPLGLRRLGLPCHLMGTGMAFPWASISQANLATGHIVEDLQLGIELARAGTPALFCPDALVTSVFPSSTDGIDSQRARWEHGHLGVIMQEAPRLLLAGIAGWDRNLIGLALDLMVPPLALLTLLVAAVWAVAGFFFLYHMLTTQFIVASVACGLLLLSVMLSWLHSGWKIISLGTLLLAPFYALWKIPLYVRFFVSRQSEWIRSKRD
jgi:cellulose synthase/poly-beta-1,6-N-acetylglucosamine synthase-like glycosyltransferase